MKKYIKIKDEIIEEMNSFLLINNLFHETLGVHWRGCDITINRNGGTIPQEILFSKITKYYLQYRDLLAQVKQHYQVR